jgi:probable F420-dependent oxidoreductase
MNIGKLGVWALTSFMTGKDTVAFAKRVEKWGYGTLWVPEVTARDPIVTCALLLEHTTKLNLATGVVSVYSRDPYAMINAQYALAEQSGGRFLLGVGLSHGPFVEGVLGHKYEKPAPAMRRYLESLAKMKYMGPQPSEKPKTVIGALGPKMLEVAKELSDGSHPYNITPEHTAVSRKALGPGKLLCPEQLVLLEKDPATARALGRKALALSLTLPNYRNNYLRQGFKNEDLDNGGSDKLIDGILAWGDEKAIRGRIQQHWDAGADHVCIQPLRKEGATVTAEDEKGLEALAPG